MAARYLVVMDPLRRAMTMMIHRARTGGGCQAERSEQRGCSEHMDGFQAYSPIRSERRTRGHIVRPILRTAFNARARSPLSTVSSRQERRA